MGAVGGCELLAMTRLFYFRISWFYPRSILPEWGHGTPHVRGRGLMLLYSLIIFFTSPSEGGACKVLLQQISFTGVATACTQKLNRHFEGSMTEKSPENKERTL